MRRGVLSRWVVMLTALVCAAGTGQAVAAPASAAPPGPVGSASAPADEPGPQAPAAQVAAMRQAHRSGRRVEIVGQRRESSRTFANPDGTLTQEITPRPDRVHRGDDSWVNPDMELSTALDGSLVPAATAVGLRFSGGGDSTMATISDGGKSLALSWPEALPEPSLDGDTAVYADVLPGVDLRVRAEVDGFSEVLVVTNRQAADDPGLDQIRLGVSTVGVSTSVTDSGRLDAVDAEGNEVFGAPTPLMWDSSDSGQAAASARSGQPSAGRHSVAMGMALTDGGDGLTITPDHSVLTDPDTVYPVFIDPSVSTSIDKWTYVDKQFPNEAYMKNGHSGGRDDLPAGHYVDDGVGTQRSYVYFKFAKSIAGKRVTKAEFRAYSHYQWWNDPHNEPICSKSADAPTRSTTWKHQPKRFKDLGCHNVKRGEWIGFNATAALQQAADNGWRHLGFELYSGKESSKYGRETFSISGHTKPRLSITVDSRPNTPTRLGVSPCYTACSSPAVTSSRQATLRAHVSDPDGGNLAHVKFEVWSNDYSNRVDHTYTTVTNIKSGTTTSWRLSYVHADNHTFHFKVKACDRGWCSRWSSWFTFTTDATDPSLPQVSSTDYPAMDSATDGPWSGGVGVAGIFHLAAPDSDTAEFAWSLDSTGLGHTIEATDGAADLSLKPPTDMTHRLYVQSVDAAGNRSEIAEYEFAVKPAPATAGVWPLDESTGTTAHDASGAGHDLTATGTASWGPGHVGPGAVELDGASGSLASGVSAIDTTGSFTVSAWVYLEADDGFKTAVSQDGTVSSAFYLQYRPTSGDPCHCWAFIMRTGDGDIADAPTVRALSTTDMPVLDEWTNLVGVFDSPQHQLSLYVNGVLQQSVGFTQAFGASGPLRVGRALTDGAPADFWPGDIDQVGIYQRVLSDHEIYQLAHPAGLQGAEEGD